MSVIAEERTFSYESGLTEALNAIILKQPTKVTIAFDFDRKLDAGSTISSATVSQQDSNPALTGIGAGTVNNECVTISLSDWTAEANYRLRCSATMSDTSIVVVDGRVQCVSY